MKRSPHLSIDSALRASTRTISNSNAAFFQKEGEHYVIHFLSSNLRWADETVLRPLLTTLVQFGVIDGGCDMTRQFVEREMRLLPNEARFIFVGEFVGASNALDVFVRLPSDILERVSEVHLQHYVPTADSLSLVLDKHAKKIFLIG